MITSSVVFALPTQSTTTSQSHGNVATSQGSNHAAAGQATGQAHLAAAQLTACQHRQNAINTIISRIDTRAQNQITLFSTIATRVETFYTSQGKTLTNYSQLVTAVNTAEAQANSDFATMRTTSSFSCSLSNPKGMVTAFQGYLKLEISDLQNYRTAVKNLIVGVASAQGITISSSSTSNQTSTSQGGK
jgi:hypothetical protein